ncbi:ubiquitin carboxyl-terminal hydrolase 31-like [Microplitis mediator]|uniref:ubiquitin carboxyl-terminal hydrolase 31-like n=1 Tax=Microplitis mediator TaxID=375433 RepID=UPI002552E91C|nr:ubiquitin carboxyl-terminal hydrolase 31-like [Microplitis mediator]
MSIEKIGSVMKSVSEGELGVGEVKSESKNRETNSQLKRTLTLTKNQFQNATRMSRRRLKFRDTKDSTNNITSARENSRNNIGIDQNNHIKMNDINYQDRQISNKKIFRRPSWKKIINKMVQHMSNVGVQNHKVSRHDEFKSSVNDIRVPPPRPPHIPPDRVPGVIGLRNHGNTCFMNAVLQCLSHTDILAEYFVLDRYKFDLSRRNKLNSKKYGTKGEITEQLALLLKAIWSCQYDPEMSTAFKNVVDKYGSQYRGNLQHDAQEFLLWLLDKVHEDLNQATKKKYRSIKNSFGRPDHVVADETLANHVRCNHSFVHEIFQAQFRSSLTCPRCQRQSNTFDPFLCVSVPVPQQHRQINLYVNVLYTSQQPRQVRIGVSVNQMANVKELREILASDTGIDESHMLLTEVHDEGFHRTFSDCQPLSVITENDPLYCIELPQLKEPTEQAYILLVWVNVLVKGDLKERFGSPYTMQVSRETCYDDLQKLLLKEMHTTLTDDVLTSSQSPGLFNIRVADPAATPIQDEHPCIDPCVEHPLYTEQIEQALALCADDSGPQHVKLILEWDEATKVNIIHDDTDQIEEHASVKQLKTNAELGGAVTLEECFDLYTREEILGAEDAWHCPSCNKKQEVVKKLGLWSLPDILVIHLKRFRQQGKQQSTSKLTMLVDFPLFGFDMTPHLAHGGIQNHTTVATLGSLGWSPWKKPRTRQHHSAPIKFDENVYDLYAICNHHGQDLQGGHYTAFCRNPYDSQWYCFDDTRVESVTETSLVTNSAYMLFYQRRSNNSTGNSSAASTSSTGSGLDHWVSRMPPFHFNNKNSANNFSNNKQSKSQEILCQDKIVEEKNINNFNRGCRNYATLQPQKRNVATETETGETDHYSDDEAPSRREWASPKPIRKTSSITLTPSQPTINHTNTITTITNDSETAVIHESTL